MRAIFLFSDQEHFKNSFKFRFVDFILRCLTDGLPQSLPAFFCYDNSDAYKHWQPTKNISRYKKVHIRYFRSAALAAVPKFSVFVCCPIYIETTAVSCVSLRLDLAWAQMFLRTSGRRNAKDVRAAWVFLEKWYKISLSPLTIRSIQLP